LTALASFAACAALECAAPHPAPEPQPAPAAARAADPLSAKRGGRAPAEASDAAVAGAAKSPLAAASTPRTAPSASELPVAFTAEPPSLPSRRSRAEGRIVAATQDEELARWNLGGCSDPAHASNRPGYHPAPRVRVDVELLSGSLPSHARTGPSRDRLLAHARSHGYWPFRLCYEDGLRADPKLEGRTSLRMTLAAAGTVKSVRVVHTELASQRVAECLGLQAHKLVFEPPPGRRVTLEVGVSLWPGDAPVPALLGASEDRPPTLDLDAAAALINARRGDLVACYLRGLQEDPRLWGRIELLIELDGQGAVSRTSEQTSRFPDRRVVTCLGRAIREVSFQAVRGAGAGRFVYAVRLGSPPESTSVTR
jgi:hypothetical protein